MRFAPSARLLLSSTAGYVRSLTPSVLFLHATRCTQLVAVEMLHAVAFFSKPCEAPDLHMLWVDLSKCFMEFSREVGQLLQARRGVPAQVRKAVWNLYSRPHGSFDSARTRLWAAGMRRLWELSWLSHTLTLSQTKPSHQCTAW